MMDMSQIERRPRDKPSLGNGRIRASAILFLGRGWRLLRHLLLFFRIGGKQHVMIAGLLLIIAVPIQLEEEVDSLRQPEVDVLFRAESAPLLSEANLRS